MNSLVIIFGQTTNLHLALGTATLTDASVIATVDSGLKVTSVTVTGNITDLYDWDYGKQGDDARAASVQAGYGTLGIAGHVFKVEIQIKNKIPYYYDFNY